MAKKKKEHIVFDNMAAPKKGIPFGKVNQSMPQAGRYNSRMQAVRPQKTFNRRTP